MSVHGPAKYVMAPLEQPAANAGSCRMMPTATMVRPFQPTVHYGGKRRRTVKQQQRRRRRTSKQQKGGFLPSIGEPFAAAVAKYIAPLALFGLYKFVNGTGTRKKGSRRH